MQQDMIDRKKLALKERKRQAKERAEMLENADVRAAEVMRIADQLSTNSCISILEFKTYVQPVPKLRPFVEWLLQDRYRWPRRAAGRGEL